ncbi:MAG: hypothetical protein COU63_04820 [Candidatus Pacebacteria bacterium CG10_big_fil_rev_8_21_14_0_10_36_11]|nr:hypothetical protein [Candidatus Pacearchaeota archaeon]OIP73973.1 MAG: hypothetical protein AUK08_01795 [Candidatus Pacebacteria bacterium CG2_30_36_39]PIR64388.1 MAG: hypothetical protein COU63_04820 [Candidatus Pacebacteria bacterium CG10_big_fil_rev_8_21_14_0_10_36_11]PJC42628.1 MAG: hypothetical protein CO040_03465 [Candidatus Pacebacteria bacterium CG_4_9_14_0_2_um_filter_36_8]
MIETYRRIKTALVEISKKAAEAGETAERDFLERYIFSRNAPKNSLEYKLIGELAEAKRVFDSTSGLRLKEKRLAKASLDAATASVFEAHQEFIKRGEKYIALDGKVIE